MMSHLRPHQPGEQGRLRRLQALLQQHNSHGLQSESSRVSSGCALLDQQLLGGGLARGSLVEWLADQPGSGASLLALLAARETMREGGLLMIVDRQRRFYPPALAAWLMVDLQQVILVHPRNIREECWVLDQALRCPHVAAVLAWPEEIDRSSFRRLHLAAHGSGGIGLLVRSAGVRGRPSWADVQLLVSPRSSPGGWRLDVRLLRSRGRWQEAEAHLEINHHTGEIVEAAPDATCHGHLDPELACAALDRQSA